MYFLPDHVMGVGHGRVLVHLCPGREITMIMCDACAYIIQSVDSMCRDMTDMQYYKVSV